MGVIITGALWDSWVQRYNELSGVGEGGGMERGGDMGRKGMRHGPKLKKDLE